MNRITNITKRDIVDILCIDFQTNKNKYFYWGCLDELDFLKRLYDLKNIPSNDSRYTNAEEEIWQHTINNYDYCYCWVFKDKRFLLTSDDETLLKFLSEIFHPEVRDEKGCWRELLREINALLQEDGYELFSAKKLSGRDVYSWKNYSTEEKLFIPFSQRNSKLLKNKNLILTIPMKIRNQLLNLINNCNEEFQETDETGWNYKVTTIEFLFKDLNQFYSPKCFNLKKQYIETNDIKDFICSNYPEFVFDAIELFAHHTSDSNFIIKANALLKNSSIPYKFENGKIVNSFNFQKRDTIIGQVQEAVLKELLQDAFSYKEKGEIQIATEKLWDAFERVKTYYNNIGKKDSVNKIIKAMSNKQTEFENLFSDEFIALTKIGNNFRIRHHETDKIDIIDTRHYEYLFNRCFSLVEIVNEYLK